jgi:hypothetical protein
VARKLVCCCFVVLRAYLALSVLSLRVCNKIRIYGLDIHLVSKPGYSSISLFFFLIPRRGHIVIQRRRYTIPLKYPEETLLLLLLLLKNKNRAWERFAHSLLLLNKKTIIRPIVLIRTELLLLLLKNKNRARERFVHILLLLDKASSPSSDSGTDRDLNRQPPGSDSKKRPKR